MTLPAELRDKIVNIIQSDEVVLFMKGSRQFPQCGFSASVVQMLNTLIPKYTTVNVLTDPEIRDGIKKYADWPTIPQLYVRGEFIGGSDIVRSMFDSGELAKKLGATPKAPATPPKVVVTPSAQKAFAGALADGEPGDVVHLTIGPDFQHDLDMGPAIQGASVIDFGPMKLSIDAMSADRAEGVVIDFIDGPQGAGFKIDNPNRPPEVREISPAELHGKLASGEIKELFDVRTPKERETASIEGARLLDEVAMQHIATLDKKTPIAFHCHHGGRSRSAAEHFRDEGFRTVYNLAGGIDAWSQTVDPKIPRY
jgi:monothiol glutaredoxin